LALRSAQLTWSSGIDDVNTKANARAILVVQRVFVRRRSRNVVEDPLQFS
jgi:hypothetical protein